MKNTLLWSGLAFDDGGITLSDGMQTKLLAQAACGLAGLGEHHDATHRQIQAMHQSQIDITRFLVCDPDIFLGEVKKGVAWNIAMGGGKVSRLG